MAVVVAVLAAGCGVMPFGYGAPPADCILFDPETQVDWAGYGTPEEFGLWPTAIPGLGRGDIYVGVARDSNEPDRWWCHVPDDGTDTSWGPVPDGWVRPP